VSGRTVKIDRAALGAILKGAEVRKHLREVAAPLVGAIEADPEISKLDGARVYLDDFETDRAVVQVIVEHSRASGTEAKFHPIWKAARNAGLRVDLETP
jgi:hypothetical protein